MILSHTIVRKLNHFIQTNEPTPITLIYSNILERNQSVIETIRISPTNTYIVLDDNDRLQYGFYKSLNLYMILSVQRLVIGYIPIY